LAAPKLLPHHDLLIGVNAVDLKHVLGDIQTDRGNLHLDGSPHVIVYDDHPMALRCRERAPSTTSETQISMVGSQEQDIPGTRRTIQRRRPEHAAPGAAALQGRGDIMASGQTAAFKGRIHDCTRTFR
jgi:hypothetical protein